MWHVTHDRWHLTWYTWHVTCDTWYVTFCEGLQFSQKFSFLAAEILREWSPHTMCNMSHLTCHMSHVTGQMLLLFLSPIFCCLVFLVFFLNKTIKKKSWPNGGASWWRVCYKRGLPHPVFSASQFYFWAGPHCIVFLKTSCYGVFAQVNKPIYWIGQFQYNF